MKENKAKNDSNQSHSSFRGTPPNRRQLAEFLKENVSRWEAVRETALDFGVTWKWAYSDNTEKWSCRAYLPGDRFFAALTLTETGFEVSLNLKAEEWGIVPPVTPQQEAKIAGFREKALDSGDEPAWVHVPVSNDDDLAIVAALFVARGRRVQKPRLKPAKRK